MADAADMRMHAILRIPCFRILCFELARSLPDDAVAAAAVALLAQRTTLALLSLVG